MGRYSVPISFRLTEHDINQLDKIVAWETKKGPMLLPSMCVNRTAVLRALIEREVLRLEDEEARIAQALVDAKKGETPKQRKSRVQRERRERKRNDASKRAPLEIFAKEGLYP